MNEKVKLLFGQLSITICYALIGNTQNRISRIQRFLCSILSKLGLSYYHIESISSYQQKYNNVKRILLVSKREGLSALSTDLRSDNIVKSEKYPLPDIYLSEFQNVCFTGNSDLLVDTNRRCVINDYCYDLDDSIFFVDGLLYRQKNNYCILRNNFRSELQTIECGIIACGKFSKNYYHTLYENLSRLTLLDKCNIPICVPILVDEMVMNVSSMTEALRCLVGNNRKIVKIQKKQLYCCRHLYYLDHIHQITPHRLKNSNNIKTKTVYDPSLLLSYRNRFLLYKGDLKTSKRIFLSRANTTHRKFNEEEIFDILKKYGFVKVDSATYSFFDQIALFNNSDFIVGGSGAAFSNILFANQDCKVICFRSIKGEGTPLFQTIANIVGLKFYQYNSDSSSVNKDIHAGYYINPSIFEAELKKLL